MPKTFQELAQETEDEIGILSSQASTAVLAVSTADIVAGAMSDNQFDAGFAIDEYTKNIQALSIELLQNAMVQGYTQELEGRAEIAQNDNSNIAIDFTFDESEKEGLFKWPILGHSIDEIAIHLALNVRFAMQTIVAKLNTGAITAQQLPTLIEAETQKAARQVSSSVTNAYLAGAQAARALFGSAISVTANSEP